MVSQSFLFGDYTDRSAPLQYHMHPAAVLQVLEHHSRRNKRHRFSVGALMGHVSTEGATKNNSGGAGYGVVKNGKTVRVTASLPLISLNVSVSSPVEERFDWEGHANAVKMHKKVYPRDEIIGWYTTSGTVGDTETEIHEFFAEKNGVSIATGELLVVTVDASLESADKKKKKKGGPLLPINAYVTRELQVDDVALGWEWIELLDDVEFVSHSVSSWEQLAIRAYTPLTIGNKEGQNGDDDNGPVLLSESVLVELQSNMVKLLRLIDSLQKQYVEVQAKADGGNDAAVAMEHARIGKSLSAILQQVSPILDSGKFDQVFNNTLQDLMMCIYLGNLTRSQLQMAERLLATPDPTPVQQERTGGSR